MDYRIIIETELSGKKWYYVQKRYLFYFWLYLREARDITMGNYKICLTSLEDADALIQSHVNQTYSKNQSVIIKREYLIR